MYLSSTSIAVGSGGEFVLFEEVRFRPVEELLVEEDVDLFVVEGDQSGDRLKLSGREVVGPGQVGVHGLADPDRPVAAGGSLVRARGLCLGGDQVIEIRLTPIQVIACL